MVETHRYSSMVGIYGDRWYYVASRQDPPPKGTDEIELQKIGVPADGRRTNSIHAQAGIASDLAERLAAWEKKYPAQPPISRPSAIPEHERKVLRSMGYVG